MLTEEKFRSMGYSEKAIGIILKGENIKKLEDADIVYKDVEDCGDILTLYLKINDDKITDASYEYEGCYGLRLAASILTNMIKGKTINNAVKIKFDDILIFAEKVPDEKQECIHFAVDTFNKAIADYKNR